MWYSVGADRFSDGVWGLAEGVRIDLWYHRPELRPASRLRETDQIPRYLDTQMSKSGDTWALKGPSRVPKVLRVPKETLDLPPQWRSCVTPSGAHVSPPTGVHVSPLVASMRHH